MGVKLPGCRSLKLGGLPPSPLRRSSTPESASAPRALLGGSDGDDSTAVEEPRDADVVCGEPTPPPPGWMPGESDDVDSVVMELASGWESEMCNAEREAGGCCSDGSAFWVVWSLMALPLGAPCCFAVGALGDTGAKSDRLLSNVGRTLICPRDRNNGYKKTQFASVKYDNSICGPKTYQKERKAQMRTR